MNIKGFRVKNQKIQKLWIIMFIAFVVAVSLIILSFFFIFKNSNKDKSNIDLFNFNSYYTKYSIKTYSNKNQNTYMMEEYCLKNSNDINFRFNTINSDNDYSYIIKDNTFYIKSDNQLGEFKNEINKKFNNNLLSLYTYINIYTKLNEIIENNLLNESKKIVTNVEEKDGYISYKISLNIDEKENKNSLEKENEFIKYIETIYSDMKVSMLELVIDKNTHKPTQYIVYTADNKGYIDITYEEFEFNPKIDEKVFSF